MPLFRKRPVVIEAVQFTGENFQQIEHFTRGDTEVSQAGEMTIETLEGTFHISTGDWVIRGVRGEHYPCKPDIFSQTYETAD